MESVHFVREDEEIRLLPGFWLAIGALAASTLLFCFGILYASPGLLALAALMLLQLGASVHIQPGSDWTVRVWRRLLWAALIFGAAGMAAFALLDAAKRLHAGDAATELMVPIFALCVVLAQREYLRHQPKGLLSRDSGIRLVRLATYGLGWGVTLAWLATVSEVQLFGQDATRLDPLLAITFITVGVLSPVVRWIRRIAG